MTDQQNLWFSGPLAAAVGKLTAGYALARLASALALLAFAPAFGPEPFALLGFYYAAVALLWIGACGRYETAILTARSAAEADAAARLCWWIGLTTVFAVLPLTWMLAQMGAVGLGGWAAPNLGLALALGGAGRVAQRIEMTRATRQGAHQAIAMSTMVMAALQPLVVLLLWVAGVSPIVALVCGDVAGYMASAIVLRAKCQPYEAGSVDGPIEHGPNKQTPSLAGVAWQWRELPLLSLPASLLSVLFVSLPAFAISNSFSAALAGQMLVALRLTDAVALIVANVATLILQHHISTQPHASEALKRIVKGLAASTVIVFLIGAFGALVLSSVLAGTRWAQLLNFIALFSLLGAGLAISGPLIAVIPMLRREARAIPLHLTLVAAGLGATGAAASLGASRVVLLFGTLSLARAALVAALVLKTHDENSAEPKDR